jgi:hypothetical protein
MYIIEGIEIGMLLTSVNPVKYNVGWYLLPAVPHPKTVHSTVFIKRQHIFEEIDKSCDQ